MWVSEKLWQEAEKILRTEDLTKKMKQITEDYADLVTKHINYAEDHTNLDYAKIIASEIAELRSLYTEFMLRMEPFDTGMSEKERAIHLGVSIISTIVALAALAIALL